MKECDGGMQDLHIRSAQGNSDKASLASQTTYHAEGEDDRPRRPRKDSRGAANNITSLQIILISKNSNI